MENQSEKDHGENLVEKRVYNNYLDEVHQSQEFNQGGCGTNDITEAHVFNHEQSGKQNITKKKQINQSKMRKMKGKKKVIMLI